MANNEQIIWDFLINAIGNPYGVAGLMGNLQSESALSPTNLQDSFNKAWGVTDQQFTDMVDKGQFDFCCNNKGAWGYGLAQWTSVGRRINLWNYKNQKQVSIGDLNMQLEFLINELKTGYKSVYNVLISAKSVREASDIVLTRFEIPADQSENMKIYRAKLGQKFYDKYANKKPLTYKDQMYRVTATSGLNVRQSANVNSDIVTQMPTDTLFAIDRNDGEWGYIPVVKGWTFLKYAKLV